MVLAALCVIFGVFAFPLPLERLIFPIAQLGAQMEVPGVWWAGLATVLIVAAILIGLVIYALTMRSGKLRRVETYIGGERLQDVYVSGEQAGPARHLEVTGTDFYNTIEQLPCAATALHPRAGESLRHLRSVPERRRAISFCCCVSCIPASCLLT